MTHFGIICPPYPGHINPLAALGRELQSRGHCVTFLQIPDVEHGGMNTVLDSLTYGVPLVAIPITFEQPGTGARIRWTGIGEVIPVTQLSVDKLRTAIQQVLTEDSYSKNALKMQQAIAQAGGVKRAADIITQAIASKQPALSPLTSGASTDIRSASNAA